MPTLLEEPELQTVEETDVEEFDLERLTRLSAAPPAIEPPRFELLERERPMHWGRTVVTGLLSAVIVLVLLNLRPAIGGSYAPASTTATSGACPIGN